MLLAGLVLLPLLGAPQVEVGAIAGTVRESGTRAPLRDAVVSLPSARLMTRTDTAGRYLLAPVPAGTSQVFVRRIGYAPGQFLAIVAVGDTVEISIELTPQPVLLPPIETHATLPGLISRAEDSAAPAGRALTGAEIRGHPLLAEPDALMALGGGEVVLRTEAPTGLNVRGGTSDQVTHAVDGIPILNPFHQGGVFSALNPDALDRLELRGVVLPSEAAEGLSGAVLASTRRPGDALAVQTGLSTSHLRGTVDGPLPGGRGFLLSLRTAFPGLLTHPRDPTYLRGDSHDWLASLRTPALGGQLQLLGFGAGNSVDASALASTQLSPGEDPPRNRFDWSSRSFGLGWNGALGTTALQLRAWRALGTAGAEWRAADSLPERMRSSLRQSGASLALEHHRPGQRTMGGLRMEWTTATYRVVRASGSASLFALAGRRMLWQPFLSHRRELGHGLSAEATATATLTTQEGGFSPALAVRQELGRAARVSLSFSRRHQFLQSLRNPESVVGHIFPAELPALAGGSGVDVGRSDEAGVEFELRPASALRLELRGFVRRFEGLTLVAPRQADPFVTAGLSPGSSRARGASLALRWSGPRHDVVARYALQRVRVNYGDTTYIPAWGGRQLLDAGLVLRPMSGTALRLSVSGEAGARATTIEDPFEWEACNLLDRGCEFAGTPAHRLEPLGGASLPGYVRTDLGLRQTFGLRLGGRPHSLAAYGTLTNLFSRRNLMTFVRDPGTGGRTAVTPRPRALLVLGAEWSF